jgi:thioredoxin 1
MANGKVVVLNADNFDNEVTQSSVPVLVDFWAAWCGPCRMIAPIVDQLAEQYEGKLKVGKVNVDEEKELAVKFQVMTIPTLIFFKDGKIVNQMVGAHPKGDLEKIIDKLL